jgi:hypothetical protein
MVHQYDKYSRLIIDVNSQLDVLKEKREAQLSPPKKKKTKGTKKRKKVKVKKQTVGERLYSLANIPPSKRTLAAEQQNASSPKSSVPLKEQLEIWKENARKRQIIREVRIRK